MQVIKSMIGRLFQKFFIPVFADQLAHDVPSVS